MIDKAIRPYRGKHIIARYRGRDIGLRLFEMHVVQVSLYLGEHQRSTEAALTKVLNLCEDRYHFLLAFTASMLAKRVTIMPANRSEGELARLIALNPGVFKITDRAIEVLCATDALISSEESVGSDFSGKNFSGKNFYWKPNLIADDLTVAELYTSGSTGTPLAHNKTWGQLVSGAQQINARFCFDSLHNTGVQTHIVATVPPQHMFGFELSIVLPLVCGVCIYHRQPFYPLDIQSAIADMPAPRVLVTTPTHLKACTTLTQDWPDIEGVISATSVLSKTLAMQVEGILKAKVEEVYGCSEVGAIGTRRLTQGPDWELLADYTLTVVNGDAMLRLPMLAAAVTLPDKLEVLSNARFNLVGRAGDMIKMGGKRGSLAHITARIKALAGVQDAVVFRQQPGNERQRLAALVVVEGALWRISEEMFSQQMRSALLKEIDPVFLPRIICRVHTLPYNDTGKLPVVDLVQCIRYSRLAQQAGRKSMLSASFVIPATHPSLAGHFPGRPVIPGVVTLDYVVSGLLEQLPGAELKGLPQVKFLQPLSAQVQVNVNYTLKREILYQFSCESDDGVVLQGQIQLATEDATEEKLCDG